MIPGQFPPLGQDASSLQYRDGEGAKGGLVQRVIAIKRVSGREREAALHLDARHDLDQWLMAISRQELDIATMALGKLPECGLEKDKIAQLFMKNGVTSGHGRGIFIPQSCTLARRNVAIGGTWQLL